MCTQVGLRQKHTRRQHPDSVKLQDITRTKRIADGNSAYQTEEEWEPVTWIDLFEPAAGKPQS